MGANSSSQFVLTAPAAVGFGNDMPELGAQVMIKSADGVSYPLIDTGAMVFMSVRF
jgi:hypothetical protein